MSQVAVAAVVAQAKRMGAPGLRTSLRTAFESMWTIDGHRGIFWYVSGCKKDRVAEPGEVIAETNGAVAVFKRDEVAEKVIAEALGVELPE
jgi:hypothetical protein